MDEDSAMQRLAIAWAGKLTDEELRLWMIEFFLEMVLRRGLEPVDRMLHAWAKHMRDNVDVDRMQFDYAIEEEAQLGREES